MKKNQSNENEWNIERILRVSLKLGVFTALVNLILTLFFGKEPALICNIQGETIFIFQVHLETFSQSNTKLLEIILFQPILIIVFSIILGFLFLGFLKSFDYTADYNSKNKLKCALAKETFGALLLGSLIGTVASLFLFFIIIIVSPFSGYFLIGFVLCIIVSIILFSIVFWIIIIVFSLLFSKNFWIYLLK